METAQERLLKWLKPGDKVYTILDYVSASGMSRDIRVVTFKVKPGDKVHILNLTMSVRDLLDLPKSRNGWGIRIHGCGMDMGFEIVYRLGRALWPNGTAKDSDGGYALEHEWL